MTRRSQQVHDVDAAQSLSPGQGQMAPVFIICLPGDILFFTLNNPTVFYLESSGQKWNERNDAIMGARTRGGLAAYSAATG